MQLHLYYLDKGWKKSEKGCADNYNLVVDMENKTFHLFTNPFCGYYAEYDIEVKRKSDITDYAEYLRKNGYKEE